MFVKKYAADSLDEALKQIKRELGPDAIILKTVTNKGPKGLINKNKIEITAGITEKEYVKKAQVESVLSDDQKEKLNQNSAKSMSNVIQSYKPPVVNNNKIGRIIRGPGVFDESSENVVTSGKTLQGENKKKEIEKKFERDFAREFASEYERKKERDLEIEAKDYKDINDINDIFEVDSSKKEQQIKISDQKIKDLEDKIKSLDQSLRALEGKSPSGIGRMRSELRSLGIDDLVIRDVIKKAIFELKEDDLNDYDVTYDFTLRELTQRIYTEIPLYAKYTTDHPIITILLSSGNCGQTSTMLKLKEMKKDSICIVFRSEVPSKENRKHEFITKILNVEVKEVFDLSNLIMECRKAKAQGLSVFIDFKEDFKSEMEKSKILVDSLRNSFEEVEALLVLSALHADSFNKRSIQKFRSISDGLIITNIDLCLSFAEILNIHFYSQELPLKFFTNGPVIPSDIEVASPERIIGEMFKL